MADENENLESETQEDPVTTVDEVKAIRAWLRTCPLINASAPFMIDYFDDDPTCYAIYSSPSEITYKTDILGNTYADSVQTKSFYFRVSMPATADARVMADNLELLNGLITWMQTQALTKNWPVISGYRVIALLPTLSPYAMKSSTNEMSYQITIQLRYRKEA